MRGCGGSLGGVTRRDRAAACQVDRALWATKIFLLVGKTKTHALADAIVPKRRGVGSEEVKDHSIGAPRSVQPVDGSSPVRRMVCD